MSLAADIVSMGEATDLFLAMSHYGRFCFNPEAEVEIAGSLHDLVPIRNVVWCPENRGVIME